MSTPSVSALRSASAAELEQLGRDSLRQHVVAQAEVARAKHGVPDALTLEQLLADRDAVRFPVRLVYEFGEMALHQFGQPAPDPRDPSVASRIIYLRPSLRRHPDLVPLAVAYLIPLINYGEIVSDEVCLDYCATLFGIAPDECYRRLCALADTIGATTRMQDDPAAPPSDGCGCSSC